MEETTDSTETYIKVLEWFHTNKTKVLVGTGVVVVVGIVAGVTAYEKSEAQAAASADLYSVPLITADGNQISAVSSGTLINIAQKYPDTTAGQYADLLAAESLFLEGKYADAEHAFAKFADTYPAADLLPQAQMGVAASLEAEGKTADAAQKYQTIIVTYPSDANIVAPAKLTLARLDEEQNKPEQALTYYEDLARINNPYDPWAAEARERGSILLARHPELRKAPPTQTRPTTVNPPGTLNFSAPPPAQSAPAPNNSGVSKLLTVPAPSTTK